MIINRLIKLIINEQGIKIEELSADTGIDVAKLNRILNCEVTLSPTDADKILKYLKIKLKDVLEVY